MVATQARRRLDTPTVSQTTVDSAVIGPQVGRAVLGEDMPMWSNRPPRLSSPAAGLVLALVAGVLTAPQATLGADPTVAPEPAPSAPAAVSTRGERPTDVSGTWRRVANAPFASERPSGGWTGTEAIVVAQGQQRPAAAYDPASELWRRIARPPRPIASGTHAEWTGSELLFVEQDAGSGDGLLAYDPAADSWRATAPAPVTDLSSAAMVGAKLVALASDGSVASYDPAVDAWTALPPLGPAVLLAAGDEVLALTGDVTLAVRRLDVLANSWSGPSAGPLAASSARPVWAGDALLFLSRPLDPAVDDMGLPRDGRYDPATDTWSLIDNPCGLDTSEAVWTGALILSMGQRLAFDPASETCQDVPPPPWPSRKRSLRIWTGEEAIEWSGRTGRQGQARRDGIAYRPVPGEGVLGAIVDQAARPVRVRIPSLDIDLPVVSLERQVKGATPGYPACDVAFFWPVFDLPGAPGTTWILAHAQEGMFLPLLDTARRRGPDSLLGRTVELQLRDGRLFTYRTYRVKRRADNYDLGLATEGRKDWEQRLVLQTSTGIGSAPKLQIAARLLDVGTTDEPRPRPRPRACG